MLTMDADLLSYKRMMAIRYSELVYSGKWFSPLRESMDAFMATGARFTTGSVRIALYKGTLS
jgi:argininosuccinate synthase